MPHLLSTVATDPTSRAYEERVYAGVLGKIIGVYLGRPFEGWLNERIERELGEIQYYVHERLGAPLIVTDDDITGTFTFLRALIENGGGPDLSAAQIGDWWLNTIIEGRTILWWGGLGMSTEHTAFLRLLEGVPAPQSGGIAMNGATVAEQIGAQIFIDGWGLICPGDPAKAAEFARRAASVSHDGEAVYAAQVVAALVAAAFAEQNWSVLLDVASELIPQGSVIRRLIGDMRGWAAAHGDDWRATLRQVQAHYGYDKFGGNCHVVPNHAVILLALLHGNDDFQRSQMIANTAGWDTDCNAGNVGCILGVKNGLDSLNAGPDWRGPIADRIYLPTADGGRAISDAVRETYAVVNAARALQKAPPVQPKNGARFHFSLPSSVQGFHSSEGALTVENEDGRLAIRLKDVTHGRAVTPTFTPPDALGMTNYSLIASPTLYPGQQVTASIAASEDLTASVMIRIVAGVYAAGDALEHIGPSAQTLAPGQSLTLTWMLPDTGGQPIAEIGLEISSDAPVSGSVLLDSLTWSGVPRVTFHRPAAAGVAWERAWVNAASDLNFQWLDHQRLCRVIDNRATGLALIGEWEWSNYTVAAEVLPHLCRRAGLAAAVRGLRRYVALVLDEGQKIRLIEQRDGDRRILAEASRSWEYDAPIALSLTVTDAGILASAGGEILRAHGEGLPSSGAIGLLTDKGQAEFGPVSLSPSEDA